MKLRVLLIVLSVSFAFLLSAQYGLRAKINFNDYATADTDLMDEFKAESILATGFEVGFDYWFRLKSKRIEFYPEVYYSFAQSDANAGIFNSINLNRLGFNLNTHFYLLDFVEDCNCPTFSKQGPSISKGFFIHFSPGVTYNTYFMKTSSGQANKTQEFGGKIGGGVGIDVGLSDFITITPIYTYNVNFGGDWDIGSFPGGNEPNLTTSTVNNQHQLTLRIGLRLDYR